VLFKQGAQVVGGIPHAGNMRRRLAPFAPDFEHGIERALLGRTAGAEGDRIVLRVQGGELFARGAQLVRTFRGLGRKELDGEIVDVHPFFISSDDSTHDSSVYRIAPPRADQKPATWKPLTKVATIQNSSALITKMNRPSESTVAGSVSRIRIGRI